MLARTQNIEAVTAIVSNLTGQPYFTPPAADVMPFTTDARAAPAHPHSSNPSHAPPSPEQTKSRTKPPGYYARQTSAPNPRAEHRAIAAMRKSVAPCSFPGG